MERQQRRVHSVLAFVLALLTVLTSCNVSLFAANAATVQNTDLTEIIFESDNVKLSSDSNEPLEEDGWITYEASFYNSDAPVLLSDGVAGDINGDGKTTVADSVALMQYLSGADVACLYNALDVNGDKQINKQDVGALIKYVVGITSTVNMQPACVHTISDQLTTPVTCSTDGVREHWECANCQVKFSDAEGTIAVTDRYLAVKAVGHKEVAIPAEEPTCVQIGKTAGVKCKNCSTILTAPQDIPATGVHIFTDTIAAISATKTTTGLSEGTRCAVCGEIGLKPSLVPALGSEGLKYELNGDTYTVTGIGTCTDTVIVIPAFYNGKPVTAIASEAFANQTQITDVIILSYESSATIKPKGPEAAVSGGVTEIGEGAFSGCTGLTDVEMGNCVENISNAAFSGCNSLENVNISENVTNIGEGSFTGCSNLESVTIPNTVENIGNNAFSGCENLTSLDYQGTAEEWKSISENTTIWEENKQVTVSCYSEGLLMELSADGTYYIIAGIGECKDTELKLPAEYQGKPVAHIKENAFRDNATITSVSIPKSITFIGKDAFAGSKVLAKVNIIDLAAWCQIEFEAISANPLCVAKNLYLNDKLVTDLVIGNEIESISAYAFSQCNITSVTIGNGVKQIGERAFAGCALLTEVLIPDNVTSLGALVFSGCAALTFAHVGNGIKLLSAGTFSDCSKLANVTLGSSINKFGANVFANCTSLSSINIPASLTGVNSECFYNCSSLTSIVLPEGLKQIGEKMFYGCSGLISIVIPDSVTEIGAGAFGNCTSLVKVTVGSGVETIGDQAFSGAQSIVTVFIKDLAAWCEINFVSGTSNPLCANVSDEIGELYVNGALLTDLYIPAGVDKISKYAFRGITSLKTVVISDGVYEIGMTAFANCPALQTVELPASLKIMGEKVFASDTSLQNIIYNGSVAEWNKVQKTDWNNRCPISVPTIFEFVENENGYTFVGIGSSSSIAITIPEYYNGKPVTAIAKNAFKGANIISIEIPNTVTSIESGALYGCNSLYNITVAEGNAVYHSAGNCLIETASKTLIAGCNGSVIPGDGSVTSIVASAFKNCSGIESISIPASVTKIDSGAFDGCTKLNRVDITDIAAWCAIEFSNITANPLYNGNNLYLNGVLVTDLIISKDVTSISKFAFFNCTGFKTIYIGENVSDIGVWVFAGCDNVESITVDAANKKYHSAGNCLIATSSKKLVSGFNTSVIPSDGSVVTIGSGAFRHLTSLTSIVIPSSVTQLDTFVFMDCTALESVTLSEGLVTIGQSVFSGCTRLKSIVIPNTVKTIGATSFAKCTALKTLVFDGSPSEWKAVTKKANWNNGSNFEVLFTKEDHVHSLIHVEAKAATCTEDGNIEYWHCTDCGYCWEDAELLNVTNLKSVAILATGHTEGEWTVTKEATKTDNGLKSTKCTVCGVDVTAIIPYTGSEGLYFELNSKGTAYHLEGMGECTDTDLYIPAVYNGLPVTAIAEAATFPNTIVNLHIPASITKINYSGWGSKLEGVYITDLAAWCNISFGNINCNPLMDAENFYLDGKLVTELILPEGLETIKFASFAGCESITSIVFPESIKKVKQYAFERCSGLTSVTIPKSVTSLSAGVFRYCSNIESLNVEAGNSVYHSVNNCIIETESKTLVAGCKNSVLPNDGSVTVIGSIAFEGCYDLTNIVIPDGVTTIENAAFWQCTGLQTVTIPKSVTTIGESVFRNCYTLESIIVESGNTAYHSAGNCLIETATKTLLAACNNSVIPNDGSVAIIVDYAFYGCKGLTNVVIPNGVTSIGNYAFRNCSGITSITIPASVTNVGNYAFANCSTLTNFVFNGTEAQWEAVTKGNYWSSNSKFTVQCMVAEDGHIHDQTVASGKAPTCTTSGLTEGIKCSICGKIFAEQTEIPATGHTEGEWTVTKEPTKTEEGSKRTNCTVCGLEFTKYIQPIASEGLVYTLNKDGKSYSLTGMGTCTDVNVVIAGEYNGLPVTKIEQNVFELYTTLESLYVPSSITSFMFNNFINSKNFDKIMISDLAAWCAVGHNGTPLEHADLYLHGELITDLVIPEGVTKIGTRAFSFGKFNSVVFPESLKTIGAYAFSDCPNIKKIIIPKNVTAIGEGVFANNAIENITVDPDNKIFTVINNCLVDLSKKTLIVGYGNCSVPSNGSVETIGYSAFEGNTFITEAVIPNGVKNIDTNAFENCANLVSIIIPDSVTQISSYAFYNCTALADINIPASVTFIGSRAFYGCSALQSITVEAGNTIYHSAGNCLIEIATKTLIAGCNNSVIPADGSVVSIAEYSFYGCKGLTNIVIPEGVTSIGNYAFRNCTSLANVTIPASVTNIGNYAFAYCTALTNVVIPEGVTSIGSYAFRNCTSLVNVTIPASVTNIGNYAFAYCTALTNFVFNGSEAQWEAVTKGNYWNRNGKFTVQFNVAEDGHTHDQTKIEAVAPTCTTAGLTEGIKCSICGKIFAEQTEIPATGHTEGEWTVTKEPTKTEEGVRSTNCTVCGLEFTKYIQPIASEGLVYTLNKDGKSYSLTGTGTCTDVNVVIAGEYNGLPVTIIGRDVFNEYTTLESLYVPSSITEFGWNSFWNSQNFNKIMISDLAAWCNMGISGCPLDKAQNLYLNGEHVTKLVIPEGVEIIRGSAFWGGNFNSVILPQSLATIDGDAFRGCMNLKEIVIPENVTWISPGAFSASGIENITVATGNKNYVVINNCLINVVDKALVFGYGNCSIPNDGSVVTIEYSAFDGNQYITEMVIPEGITYIGGQAFAGCTNLVSVSIPSSVTSIAGYAFSNCSSLVNVNIPTGVTNLGWGLFQGCDALKSITIPVTVTNINRYAFLSCMALTSFVFDGSAAQWEAVIKDEGWNQNCTFEVQFMVAEDGHTHDQTMIVGKAPTCTESGLTEGIKCSICGYVFAEQTEIPATGHTESEWTVTKEATKTENGLKSTKCTVCGVEFTAIIPYTGSEGLAFELSSNGKYYSLVGMGTCTDTDLIIPSIYNGMPVTAIAKEAFSDNTSILSVFIPGSITNIYMHAFYGCKNIKSVYTDDLAAWCSRSFANYSANPMYYGAKLYVNGELLTDLVVPAGVETIGEFAFDYGVQIQSVAFPEGLKVIDRFAFRGCKNIKSIVLPESLTTIKNGAFQNCTITEIFIPANVIQITNNAFMNTTLTSITVDKNNKVYHSTGTCLIRTEDKVLELCLDGIIPSDGSVTTLSSSLFSNSDITEILIPNTITNIEQYAFAGCDKLSLFIYDGSAEQWEAVVKGQDWNSDCTFTVVFMVSADGHRHEIVKIDAVAPTCTETGLSEGTQCSSCGEVFKKPATVKALGHKAGEWKVVTEPTNTAVGVEQTNCTVCNAEMSQKIPALGSVGLEYVLNEKKTAYTLVGIGTCTDTDIVIATTIDNIPVTAIAASAFANNKTLTSVVMSNKITSVGEKVFYSCTNLKSVTLSTGLKTLGEAMFRNCTALTNVNIPKSVTSIGSYAFANTGLTSVKLPSGVTSIGAFAFRGCKSLTKVDFNSKLKNIGSDAFEGCVSLTGVSLPSSLTSLGTYAFSNCDSLTEITIPANVSAINYGAFSDCDMLATIKVDENNTYYAVVDNCLIDLSSKALVAAVNGFTIPADGSVTSIMTAALQGLDMVEVVIPDTITKLGKNIFTNCEALTSVYFGSGITNIGSSHFSNCPALVSLKVSSDNATYSSVENCVIERAKGALVVACANSTIPADGSVTTIGAYAFYGLTGLTSIAIPKYITSIGEYAFYGCTNLQAIKIPSGNIAINKYAFYNCKSLTEVVLPDGIANIADYAFTNCYALVSVVIPASVTSIGASAFANCSKLETIYFTGTEEQWNAITKGKNWNSKCNATVIYGPIHTHSAVHKKAISATCVKEGNLEYWYCSECGGCWKDADLLYITNLKDVTLPATGHTEGEWTVTKEATKTENGLKSNKCTVCGTEINEIIPYTGSVGLEYELSSDGKYYSLVGMGTCTDTDLYIPSVYEGLPVTTISKNASIPTTVENVYIPSSINTISYIWNSTKIKGVYIYDLEAWCNIKFSAANSNPLTRAKNLYLNGTLVTELVIPEGIKTIKFAAFRGCASITSVILPESLKKIEDRAFYGCTGLTTVYIPAGVSYINGNVFMSCTALETINIDAKNEYYSLSGNCLISKADKSLIWGNHNSIIPTDGSVVSIAAYAFYSCTGLTNIVIPEGVTSIGSSAFYGCSELASVIIPKGVTDIASYAFGNCSNITSITIPASIINIGNYAFANCIALADFMFNGSEAQWNAVTKGDNWNNGSTFSVVFTGASYPEYAGPSENFKFTLASVLQSNSYESYTNFLALAEKSYLIPALAEKMIPQGMDIWEERGWLIISGYFDDASTSDCSVLVAVDMNTGAYVGEYYITNADGTPHTSHAGGIAITDKDIYISNNSTLFRIPLTAILEAGQCGKVKIADSFQVPVRASFCNYSGGYLWVGDFQYGTSYPTQSYQYMTNRDGVEYRAWTVGYKLDPTTENGIKASAMVEGSYATPDIILSTTERIQGFAAVGDKIALSQSYGRTKKSTILTYDSPIGTEAHSTYKFNEVDIPVYFLDGQQNQQSITALPMSEGLATMGGKLYILFESGADKYANDGGLDPTENVWVMKID